MALVDKGFVSLHFLALIYTWRRLTHDTPYQKLRDVGILYIKCPGHVLDITKFMSMDRIVLDIPSMDIVPSHYQHWMGVLACCES